jgi:hypothetical protein
MLKYFGPYGFILVSTVVFLFFYFLISFKLYPDIHKQVFKILWELTKQDFKHFFVFFDVIIFYLIISFISSLLIYFTVNFSKKTFLKLKKTTSKAKERNYVVEDLIKKFPQHKEVIQNYQDIVVPFFLRIKDLPASQEYHHNEAYGLFKHSLETVQNLLERKTELKKVLGIDEKTAEKTAVLLGLFHDIGKIYPEVPFKYQNALAGYEIGNLRIPFNPKLLARLIYTITIQHTEYAKLDPDPLVRFLISADTQSVREERLHRLETCLNNFVSNLIKQLEELRYLWNDKKFFKVIVNPAKNEVLVNLNLVREIYTLLGCKYPLTAILEEGIKKNFVKPIEGNTYGKFKIGNLGTFPAVVFDLKKLPLNTGEIESVPEYIIDKYEGFRKEFLKALAEIISKIDVNNVDSPVVYYRDRANEEWYLVKAAALPLLKEKGINITTLKDLGSLTGFEIKQVKRIGTKALKVPAKLVSPAI